MGTYLKNCLLSQESICMARNSWFSTDFTHFVELCRLLCKFFDNRQYAIGFSTKFGIVQVIDSLHSTDPTNSTANEHLI